MKLIFATIALLFAVPANAACYAISTEKTMCTAPVREMYGATASSSTNTYDNNGNIIAFTNIFDITFQNTKAIIDGLNARWGNPSRSGDQILWTTQTGHIGLSRRENSLIVVVLIER